MDQKLVCRKCQGNHLTIKCGKPQNLTNSYEDSNRKYKKYEKSFTIKISKLPLDITKKELEELLIDWGHVKNINVVVYETTSTAFVNFSTLDEATYFVKALNRTNFDNNFIFVSLVDS
jgi:RNA recognition motif-containing protein